jgi:hypothetical protein
MSIGTVIASNPRSGMIAVLIDGEACSVFNLVAGAVALHHRVSGDLDSSLCQSLVNLSNGEALEVTTENLDCSREVAARLVAAK